MIFKKDLFLEDALVELDSNDIARALLLADSKEQAEVLKRLSAEWYNNNLAFQIHLAELSNELKNYNHDIQNNIKNMISQINENIG